MTGDLPSTCSAKVPLGISSTISFSLEVFGFTLDVESIGVGHEVVRCSGWLVTVIVRYSMSLSSPLLSHSQVYEIDLHGSTGLSAVNAVCSISSDFYR